MPNFWCRHARICVVQFACWYARYARVLPSLGQSSAILFELATSFR